MSKGIRELYTKAGLTPPKGKGIHTKEFHKLAVKVKKGNPSYSWSQAYATAMKILGRNKSVKKSHRR